MAANYTVFRTNKVQYMELCLYIDMVYYCILERLARDAFLNTVC